MPLSFIIIILLASHYNVNVSALYSSDYCVSVLHFITSMAHPGRHFNHEALINCSLLLELTKTVCETSERMPLLLTDRQLKKGAYESPVCNCLHVILTLTKA